MKKLSLVKKNTKYYEEELEDDYDFLENLPDSNYDNYRVCDIDCPIDEHDFKEKIFKNVKILNVYHTVKYNLKSIFPNVTKIIFQIDSEDYKRNDPELYKCAYVYSDKLEYLYIGFDNDIKKEKYADMRKLCIDYSKFKNLKNNEHDEILEEENDDDDDNEDDKNNYEDYFEKENLSKSVVSFELTENFTNINGIIKHCDYGPIKSIENENIIGAIETYYAILLLTDQQNLYETSGNDIENGLIPQKVGKLIKIYYEHYSMAYAVVQNDEKIITITYSNNTEPKKIIINGEIDYAYTNHKNNLIFCCMGNNLICVDHHYVFPELEHVTDINKYTFVRQFMMPYNDNYFDDTYKVDNSTLLHICEDGDGDEDDN
jgi:hypothetical protein